LSNFTRGGNTNKTTRKTIYCLVRIFASFEVYMHLRRSQSTMLVLITAGNENLLKRDVLQQRTCIPNSVKKGKFIRT